LQTETIIRAWKLGASATIQSKIYRQVHFSTRAYFGAPSSKPLYSCVIELTVSGAFQRLDRDDFAVLTDVKAEHAAAFVAGAESLIRVCRNGHLNERLLYFRVREFPRASGRTNEKKQQRS